MKRVLLYGLAAVAILAAIVAALPFLIPLSAYRGAIESVAERATGRAFRIAGPLRISLFPVFGLRAERIALANVAGGVSPNLAEADTLAIAIEAMPLLSGKVRVSEIVLEHPRIHLEVNRTGEGNWRFSRQGAPQSSGPSSVKFLTIHIADGIVDYANAQTGAHRSVEHLNADLSRPQEKALRLTGNLTQGGIAMTVSLDIADADAFGANAPTPATIMLSSDVLKARFQGTISGARSANGDVTVETPSLRKLAAAFGKTVPGISGFNVFKLKGHVALSAETATLSDMTCALDGMTIAGHLVIDDTKAEPSISGALAFDHLDVNPYLSSERAPSQPGWSTTPIKLDALKSIDADIELSAGALSLRKLVIRNTRSRLSLHQASLTANFERYDLYSGQGSAALAIDASRPVPHFSIAMTFANVDAMQFLGNAIGVTRIDGTANFRIKAEAEGNNENAIMHGLAGNGAIVLRNGRIRGVDLGLVARTAQNAVGDGATGDAASTAYSSLRASFAISHGVLNNRDFALQGPYATMTGSGQLDLANRTIDFKLVPHAGLGGKLSVLSVGVPFRITGSWDRLHYLPDVAGMVGGVFQGVGSAAGSVTDAITGNHARSKKNSGALGGVGSLFGIH